jgi:hypothetical protein
MKTSAIPASRLSRLNRLSTTALIDTSSADTDSSQTIATGDAPSALAMATRCFSPPDSSAARLSANPAGGSPARSR